MRIPSAEMTARWKAQAKTGDQRPIVRATIQKANMRLYPYDTATAPGGDFGIDRHRIGMFASVIFGDPSPARELPNIKSCTWTRGVDQDVATCTLTLANTEMAPMGTVMPNEDDFDQPGFLTYNRGQGDSADRWGYQEQAAGRPNRDNGWQYMLMPDRVVRTYEGYGCDSTVPPALDENLMQSGVWLIDKVTYSDDGEITLEMRDIGRLLLDQIVFPPVIPYAEYPLSWEPIRSEQVEGRDCKGGDWGLVDGTASSSNSKYGSEVVDGHKPKDALTWGDGEYWLSTGQSTPWSKVWWQVDLDSSTSLAGIRISPGFGPYRIYISVKTDKGWIGKRKIPYTVTTDGVNVNAGIPFVQSVVCDRRDPFEVVLRRKYRNVKAVRLTFAHLFDTKVGENPFRAALHCVHLYTGDYSSLHFEKGTYLKVVGNYRDYSAIVKWVCAWGGLYWPPHNGNTWHGVNETDFIQLSHDGDPTPGGGRRTISYASEDAALPKGRAWGDFMQSGTTGEATLTVDLFDKKPLMDVINYVRDVLGFIFLIDEQGAAVWRLPNLGLNVAAPKQGNYLSPSSLGQPTRARTAQTVVLDENETLLEYSTTLDSSNVRDRIFVADVNGKHGVVIRGFSPTFVKHGFRRMAGWTDQHFKNKKDCRVMADLVAARHMFTYRRSRARIPGYPAIQVDDQVRIFERVTNETYFHYVEGINSTLDMEQGTWFYELDTHWLGEDPSDAWVVKVEELDVATRAYLNELN